MNGPIFMWPRFWKQWRITFVVENTIVFNYLNVGVSTSAGELTQAKKFSILIFKMWVQRHFNHEFYFSQQWLSLSGVKTGNERGGFIERAGEWGVLLQGFNHSAYSCFLKLFLRNSQRILAKEWRHWSHIALHHQRSPLNNDQTTFSVFEERIRDEKGVEATEKNELMMHTGVHYCYCGSFCFFK